MQHIQYWLSFDGHKFDDKTDCIRHELQKKLRYSNLDIIDPDTDMPYTDMSLIDEKVHNECKAVIVRDKHALGLMKEIQNFTGFYYEIDSIGKWEYDDKENKWIIVERY